VTLVLVLDSGPPNSRKTEDENEHDEDESKPAPGLGAMLCSFAAVDMA